MEWWPAYPDNPILNFYPIIYENEKQYWKQAVWRAIKTIANNVEDETVERFSKINEARKLEFNLLKENNNE